MKRIGEGLNLPLVLGLDRMYQHLRDDGWTGPDIQAYRERLERENFDALDRFAGGGLSELRGTPIFKTLLSASALRYAMEETKAGGAVDMPSECPHGFRMVACNRCLQAEAVVPLDTRRG